MPGCCGHATRYLGVSLPASPHPVPFFPSHCAHPQTDRYNEIAELVVAAAQRRALQQRAQRQGVMLVAGEGAVVKVSASSGRGCKAAGIASGRSSSSSDVPPD